MGGSKQPVAGWLWKEHVLRSLIVVLRWQTDSVQRCWSTERRWSMTCATDECDVWVKRRRTHPVSSRTLSGQLARCLRHSTSLPRLLQAAQYSVLCNGTDWRLVTLSRDVCFMLNVELVLLQDQRTSWHTKCALPSECEGLRTSNLVDGWSLDLRKSPY